jgi:Helix-turn-helix domain
MDSIVRSQSSPRSWSGTLDFEAQAKAFEPFVDEQVVSRFLQISPRRVLEMARRGEIPAHPFGHTRKTWRFRISEIDAHFTLRRLDCPGGKMAMAVPRTQERKKHLG